MKQIENVYCCVCGLKSFTKIFRYENNSNKVLKVLKINNLPELFLYRCNNCKHHYANPQVSDSLMVKYYSEINSEYYDLNQTPKCFFISEYNRIRNIVEKLCNSGKILEIGSGFGFLLSKFSPEKWERYGIEPSPFAANYAETKLGIKTLQGFLDNNTFQHNYFDVIMLFDVIEHLKDPNTMLSLVNKYLRPNGYIIIGTGNIDSFHAKLLRENWGYFSSWEHVSFFSPISIKHLLNKNQLKIDKLIRVSYMGSFFINIRKLLENIIKRIIYLMFISRDQRLNKKLIIAFDHMIVIASKV